MSRYGDLDPFRVSFEEERDIAHALLDFILRSEETGGDEQCRLLQKMIWIEARGASISGAGPEFLGFIHAAILEGQEMRTEIDINDDGDDTDELPRATVMGFGRA